MELIISGRDNIGEGIIPSEIGNLINLTSLKIYFYSGDATAVIAPEIDNL